MFARNIQKAVKQVSKHHTSKRGYFGFNRDFELLADSMRTLMSRGQRGWNPYNCHRQNSYYYQPVNYKSIRHTKEEKVVAYCDDGSVIVKTFTKNAGGPWKVDVEEYPTRKAFEQSEKSTKSDQTQQIQADKKTAEDKSKNTTGQAQTTAQQTVEQTNNTQHTKKTEPVQTIKNQDLANNSNGKHADNYYGGDVFSQFDKHFQEVSNTITRDFDAFFGGKSNTRNIFETDPFFAEPQKNTPYHSKTIVNDNGNVTVKTIQRNANGQWETHIERYNEKDRALKSEQKLEATAEGIKAEQKKVEESTKQEINNSQANINQSATQ